MKTELERAREFVKNEGIEFNYFVCFLNSVGDVKQTISGEDFMKLLAKYHTQRLDEDLLQSQSDAVEEVMKRRSLEFIEWYDKKLLIIKKAPPDNFYEELYQKFKQQKDEQQRKNTA